MAEGDRSQFLVGEFMFTQQELLALIKICDAGTRAGGLELAELTVPLAHKIRRLIQQAAPPQNNVVPMTTAEQQS